MQRRSRFFAGMVGWCGGLTWGGRIWARVSLTNGAGVGLARTAGAFSSTSSNPHLNTFNHLAALDGCCNRANFRLVTSRNRYFRTRHFHPSARPAASTETMRWILCMLLAFALAASAIEVQLVSLLRQTSGLC